MRSALGITSALALLADVAPAEVAVRELPHHTTEATITIDAPPADVYTLVTSYASWPSFLSDVTYVRVEAGGRHDARVRFRSRALRNKTFTIAFDNEPDRKLTFRGVEGPFGGRAWGSMTFEPVDNGTRTLVIARLYMDVVGLPGLFMPEKTVRAMRHAKLRADLADGAAYFNAAKRANAQGATTSGSP